MTICMTHAEREALQLDLEACCLSLCLSVYRSLSLAGDPGLSEPDPAKLQPNEKWQHLLKCTLYIRINVFFFFYTNVRLPLILKWDATKLPSVLKLGMTGQSIRGNGFELYVCRSCHTPFVFWSGTHAGWSPRRCIRRVTWFKDVPALSVLRTCSEPAQPMRDEAPCYSDTAGCWVIYNTCESDQMQIVHADD